MPAEHRCRFPVRYYECDAYGHVNNANYLRYMQEAAFEASAAVGYDAERFAQMGYAWHIHATDIEYVQPARYGDVVEVHTYPIDLRRVSSRRAYALRIERTGALVARAVSDWAFLDRATERLTAIPAEVARAFFPEGIPTEPPSRQRFPAAPPPPKGTYRTCRVVQWREVDPAGHVNNAVYAEWAEEAGLQCIAHFGWPVTRLAAQGLGIVYRRMWIEYVRPARLGDTVEIAAWLSEVKRASAMRHFTMHRADDGALLARVNILAVCLDLGKNALTRWPEALMRDFQPNISAQST
ncbi:MAG: acyl-CoA thioesterase [Anaerolineae bacterium]|nr:acyl-CoA thioesterase [Anaerolineae bacterium]